MDVQSVVCCVGEDRKGSRGLWSTLGLLPFETSNCGAVRAVVEEKSHHHSAFSGFQSHKVEEGWVPEVTDRQNKEVQKSLEEKHLHLKCPRVILPFLQKSHLNITISTLLPNSVH